MKILKVSSPEDHLSIWSQFVSRRGNNLGHTLDSKSLQGTSAPRPKLSLSLSLLLLLLIFLRWDRIKTSSIDIVNLCKNITHFANFYIRVVFDDFIIIIINIIIDYFIEERFKELESSYWIQYFLHDYYRMYKYFII